MPKILFRPQGTDPKGTAIGGYLIGVVHRDVPDAIAASLTAKRFVEVASTFNPAKEKAPDWKAPQPPTAPPSQNAAPEPQQEDQPAAAPRGKQQRD
jgi:hypothetical protein